nr:probable L-gulonolactone oxidase 6 isoform X2 [Coffea arabica]
MYPKSEQELISIVANATSLQRKMKVATTTSHSIPKLMCPGGENGIIISTKYLNRTVNVDKSAMTITVEPGVTLRQLINASAAAGLALPYAPYWWGLTVGGMLGTGAHGSTLWGLGSAVHDYVIQLRIVTPAGPDEGYAKVRTLRNGDPELNAARVSLGVLGVISQVTLQLQPLFKRSITYVQKNDSDFGDQASTFGRQHEFADFTWYPSQRKVVYRIDDRVPSNTTGNALYDFMGFRSTPSLFLALIRTAEETQESIRDAVGKCINGGITTSILTNAAYGLTNDASSAYLGKQEDALDFDITYYRSKDPMAPRLYEDILEEIEQMAVIKYGGLPHWGKNRNLAFVGAINKYQNATEFLKVKQLYDPLGLFSNEWTDQILGIKDGITLMKDGCALEGLCICSQDSHCAPQKGYFCRPGKVYTDARVCTRLSS